MNLIRKGNTIDDLQNIDKFNINETIENSVKKENILFLDHRCAFLNIRGHYESRK